MQVPFRAGCNVKVIDDIDVVALDSELLQQQLHPAGQIITHGLISGYVILLGHELSPICTIHLSYISLGLI